MKLVQLFELLATNIAGQISDPEKRRVFGRTLYGLGEAVGLQEWGVANIERITACATEEQLFSILWKCLADRIQNNNFKNWRPVETLEPLAQGWISGRSFGSLREAMVITGGRIGLGSKPRQPKVEHVVNVGENALGFEGAHVLGAIAEIYGLLRPNGDDTAVVLLHRLQKRLKYGLPSGSAVALYEAGFSDRVLSMELAGILGDVSSRSAMTQALRQERGKTAAILTRYPKFFTHVFERAVS